MAHLTVGLAAGTGDTELIPAPGVGNRLKITAIDLGSNSIGELYLRSGSLGTFHVGNATQGFLFNANRGLHLEKSFSCDENAPLVLTRVTSDSISGVVMFETIKVSDAG